MYIYIYSQFIIYDEILKFDSEDTSIFTEDIPEEIQDLITKLLNQDPHKRLGAGVEGSENDYSALKDHPLLDEFDYENVISSKPPYIPNKILLPSLSKVYFIVMFCYCLFFNFLLGFN